MEKTNMGEIHENVFRSVSQMRVDSVKGREF